MASAAELIQLFRRKLCGVADISGGGIGGMADTRSMTSLASNTALIQLDLADTVK
jgi:hypothetical protein